MNYCSVDSCTKIARDKYQLCHPHLYRHWKYKDVVFVRRKKGSKYAVQSDIANQLIPGWNSWKAMKNRCQLSNLSEYKYYGGRGITICDRWLGSSGFKNFIEDMGPRPSYKHTIDRINPNGNYEPSNCEWATKRQQTVNKRNNTKRVVFIKCEDGWTLQLWIKRRLIHVWDYHDRRQVMGALCVGDYRWITPTTNTKVTHEVVQFY